MPVSSPSLADLLAQGPPSRRRADECSIARILDALEEPVRAGLVAALEEDSGWSGSDLARTLTQTGHEVRSHTVNRHRRGDCTCEPR